MAQLRAGRATSKASFTRAPPLMPAGRGTSVADGRVLRAGRSPCPVSSSTMRRQAECAILARRRRCSAHLRWAAVGAEPCGSAAPEGGGRGKEAPSSCVCGHRRSSGLAAACAGDSDHLLRCAAHRRAQDGVLQRPCCKPQTATCVMLQTSKCNMAHMQITHVVNLRAQHGTCCKPLSATWILLQTLISW